jgi:hypothetical protein
MGRFAAACLIFGLMVGGTEALGSTANVRVHVAPTSVRAGATVVVSASVSPASARCSGAISHAPKTVKLAARKALRGAVKWTAKIPATAPGGRWTVRVSCADSGSAAARLSVTPNDFTISAKADSLNIVQGANGTSSISLAFRSGSRQAISLSASGQPAGATISFSPSSVNVDDSYERSTSATMTVNVSASTGSGSYPITVKGTGIGATHTTTVVLKVLIPAKVVAVKSGLSSRVGCSYCYISYGIVLENVSPDEDAKSVTVTLNFLDANGLIVRSTSGDVGPIPAGTKYYWGGYITFIPSSTSPLPVRLDLASAKINEHQPKAIGGLPPVSNISVTDNSGNAHVLGEFTNPYTGTISRFADVTAVCFDAAGNVIGGGSGNPNASVTPGGRTGFDVTIEALSASQIASAQVSVEPYFTG